MFESISDIKAAVTRFQHDSSYVALRNRWEYDFNLYRLKPYDAGKGYISYTSNTPHVAADKVIALATESKLIIRVPLDTLASDERRVASNAERFWYGALNQNDERLLRLGLPPLKYQMAWYAALRGSFCVRVFVYKNDKNETVLSVDVWDAYNTSYEQGEKGLLWAANSRPIGKAQIKSEFDINVGSDTATTIEFWDGEKYSVIVDGKQWGIKPTKHDLDETPVFLIRSGAMPTISQSNYADTGKHQGESIYAANRDLHAIYNKTISDYLTIVRRGVKVPLGYWSPGGQKTIDEDIWQVEKAALVPLSLEDKIAPIIEPTMPGDAAVLMNIIGGELQRGSLPHTTYGELGFRLSGFAITQLQAAMQTVLVPITNALTQAYQIICKSLLEQFVGKKFPEIGVRGRTSRNEVFGLPKVMLLKPSDLKGDWLPEVRLEPVLPSDEAQRYYLANLARQGEDPLLSDQTIRDEVLGVQDPDLEDQRVRKQQASRLPIVKLYEAYLAAMADGRPDIAENILAELKRLLESMPQPASKATKLPSRLERTAGGTPGVGAQPEEVGVPAQVLPPESLGGMPSGALGASPPPEVGGEV